MNEINNMKASMEQMLIYKKKYRYWVRAARADKTLAFCMEVRRCRCRFKWKGKKPLKYCSIWRKAVK